MAIVYGSSAPMFAARTLERDRFVFSSMGGGYVLMAFMPRQQAAEAMALVRQVIDPLKPYLNDQFVSFFGVIQDPSVADILRSEAPGIRWFLDFDGEVSRLYGAVDEAGVERPQWILLDPALRALVVAPLSNPGPILQLAKLPRPDLHAGVDSPAPVLLAPRIFEREFCHRLIRYYDEKGGQASGFMMEEGGVTVARQNPLRKVRYDATIDDEALCVDIRARIQVRLAPFILRAFQFRPTRIERYIVASYDTETGGHFHRHRDNTTKGTMHRQFAVSINLNAEDYEGGDLRFPEFGARLYRPPTGGALVFSCSLLHEVTKMTSGRRYAVLPFLYDEASAEIRQANLAHLDPALSSVGQ